MARRSIRDLLRKKSPGRRAMTSNMRYLIDSNSFDAPEPPPPADTKPQTSDVTAKDPANSDQPIRRDT